MTTTITRHPLRRLLAALALLGAAPLAWADIYLCVDAQGRRELTDTNRPGCKPLSVPGTIPAPTARKAAAGSNKPAVTPEGFPKVDVAKQRERDANRREILESEQRAEQAKLAGLKKEYNNGEPERLGGEKNYAKYQERVADLKANIARTEKNLEMLTREISNIK
jgi:hypothetical protein